MENLNYKLYYQKLPFKFFCNLVRYWLEAPWEWHGTVETCSSVDNVWNNCVVVGHGTKKMTILFRSVLPKQIMQNILVVFYGGWTFENPLKMFPLVNEAAVSHKESYSKRSYTELLYDLPFSNYCHDKLFK